MTATRVLIRIVVLVLVIALLERFPTSAAFKLGLLAFGGAAWIGLGAVLLAAGLVRPGSIWGCSATASLIGAVGLLTVGATAVWSFGTNAAVIRFVGVGIVLVGIVIDLRARSLMQQKHANH